MTYSLYNNQLLTKRMSSYLQKYQKYHLKKVEPVKGRPKNTYLDYLKMMQRPQKVNVVKTTTKRKIPHRNYFQKEQQKKTPATAHKTEKHIKIESNPIIEEFIVRPRREATPKAKNMHRTHKSLNFKSGKDQSTGTKFLNTIQGFINKIMRSNEGCNCSDPCPWASQFFKWVEVPLQIINDHYVKITQNWEESIKPINEIKKTEEIRSYAQIMRTHEEAKKTMKQIGKDIDRTQSDSPTFQNQIFKQKQKRILMCYATQDPKIGYIQGMNLILSGILYHVKDQVKSFAVFRNIILNARSIYLDDFKECYEHINKIRQLLDSEVHDLYVLFTQIGVDLNIICLPWILSLMTCIVPLDFLHLIYEGFIRQKWIFIHKICLAIFIYHKNTLIALDNEGDIIQILSPTNQNKNDYDWEDIIGFGNSITLS